MPLPVGANWQVSPDTETTALLPNGRESMCWKPAGSFPQSAGYVPYTAVSGAQTYRAWIQWCCRWHFLFM